MGGGWIKIGAYTTFDGLLFLPYDHAAIVKHSLDVVGERHQVLVQPLGEDVDFVLEEGALLTERLVRHPTVVSYLGGELRARRPEEVRLVLDVRLGDQLLLGVVEVGGQDGADGFHCLDRLGEGVASLGEVLD